MRRKLIPLVGLFLLLGAHLSWALSLTEIRAQVRRNVRDTASSSSLSRYSDTILNSIINEGQRDVVTTTWCVQKQTSLTVSADISSALPTDAIRAYRVLYGSANIPEVTLGQIDADQNNAAWTTSTSTAPTYFIQDRARISGTTNTQMLLTVYPRPTAGSALTVWYYANAPDLSADSDIPYNSQSWTVPYSDLLVWYTSYRILYVEGIADRASAFKNLYDTRLAAMLAFVGTRPAPTPPVTQRTNP